MNYTHLLPSKFSISEKVDTGVREKEIKILVLLSIFIVGSAELES